ncbi:lactococcin 972 family bacteriocin [Curtobacterium sp. RRHDQ66]|uniref:lactococcin 972 family bacteriocin n=1 Tax=Curtobacterium guangdongense TaxID=3413380 RepID=UPI003BF13A1E
MNTKKKLVIGISLAAGLVIAPAAIASAAPTEVLGTGSQAGGVEITGTQHGSSSTVGGIQTRVADGSYWEWGVGRDDTYSNYFRESSCHGSTAVGKKTKRVTGVRGGVYSKALTPKASSGNKAYYHNC